MRLLLLSSIAAAGLMLGPDPAAADPACTLARAAGPSSGRTLAPGLRYEEVGVRCPDDAQVSGPPTVTTLHVVEVDLGTPGLSLHTSAPRAAACPADPGEPGQGACFGAVLPTSVFADAGPAADPKAPVPQVVVNANLSVSCCTVGDAARATLLRGLEVEGGHTNTRTLANDQPKAPTPIPGSATFASSLLVDASGKVSIWTAEDTTGAPGEVQAAVTGSHQILKARTVNVAKCDNTCTGWMGLNARTAVGLKDGSTLVLAVFDGEDGGAGGVTLYQAGDALRQLGAVDAIALDGGGASVMARRDGRDGYAVLSRLADRPKPGETCAVPKGATAGCERYVGNVLAVVAPSSP